VAHPSIPIPVLCDGKLQSFVAHIAITDADVTILVDGSALMYPRSEVISQLINHCHETNTVLQDQLPYEVKTFQLLAALKTLGVFGRTRVRAA